MEAISPRVFIRQVRKKISKDRHRFKDFDYDLDLSYITNDVIAMGFPSSGIESLWRNNIDDVCSMLNKYHGENYMIWNLSGRTYDYDKFEQKILDFGFPDHHSPPLELLFKIVLSMSSYLESNSENVAVVHCMGGKGRTGTVIASYMMFSGEAKDTMESLQMFAQKRSSIAKGVIQASQIRYTQYFGDIINRRLKNLDFKKSVRLRRIEMSPPPLWSKKKNGCKPVIEIYSTHHYPKVLLYSSIDSETSSKFYTVNEGPIIWNLNCLLQSDILITLSKFSNEKRSAKNKTTKMCRYSFHCAFVSEGEIELKASDFDPHGSRKNFEKWFQPSFRVKLTFSNTAEKLFATERDNAYDPKVTSFLNNIIQQANNIEEFNLSNAVKECVGLQRTVSNIQLRGSFDSESATNSPSERRKGGCFIGTVRNRSKPDLSPVNQQETESSSAMFDPPQQCFQSSAKFPSNSYDVFYNVINDLKYGHEVPEKELSESKSFIQNLGGLMERVENEKKPGSKNEEKIYIGSFGLM